MKRISSVFLVLALLVGFMRLGVVPASAASPFTAGDGVVYHYSLDGENKATITQVYKTNIAGVDGNVVVPAQVDGCDVVALGEKAFNNSGGKLKTVVLPEGLRSIGELTFMQQEKLTSITLPKSLESIGVKAFQGCFVLQSIKIYENVTSIGERAFNQCNALTTVEILSENVAIDDSAFSLAPAIETVSIAGGTIGSNAFKSSKLLTSLTLGDKVTSIGESAFAGCRDLPEVHIPASVTHIGDLAFLQGTGHKLEKITVDPANPKYCAVDDVLFTKDMKTLILYPVNHARTTYKVPSSVTTIYDHAFFLTINIEEVELPAGLKEIQAAAFYACYLLQYIIIPDGVETIGDNGFFACSAFQFIHMPPSVTTIGNNAFDYAGTKQKAPFCYIHDGPKAETYAEENNRLFEICIGHAETVRVVFYLDDNVTPLTVDGKPVVWTVASESILSELVNTLPADMPDKDGKKFSHWEFVKKDAQGNVIERIKVGGSFAFDPEALLLPAAGEDVEEDYICSLVAVYTDPENPEPEPEPEGYGLGVVLAALLGGLGIGGLGVGGAALTGMGILGAAALALPLLYKLITMVIDKFKSDATEDPDSTDDPDTDKPDDDGSDSSDNQNGYVQPPKTGDNQTITFAAGLLGLLAAAMLVMVQRRRREELAQ